MFESEARQVKTTTQKTVAPSTIESTSIAPRQRPKGQAVPQSATLGLPIQTSIAPRKRPTASNPQTPVSGKFAFSQDCFVFLGHQTDLGELCGVWITMLYFYNKYDFFPG